MRRKLLLCIPLVAIGTFASGCGDDGNTHIDGSITPPPIDAPPPAPANLTVAPLSTDFGSVVIGQTSTATTFTITNTGASTSDQVSVAFQGTTTDFHIASNTCQTLAPAATCTVGVTFGPTAPGARNAMLTLHVAGSTTSASLTGTGTMPGNLAVSPSSHAFADVVLGTASTELDTITITNTGTVASGSLSVQATGSDPTQFTKATDTCSGQTLAGGATCTLGIKFAPTTAGAKSAGFTVLGNPGGSVTSIVTGTAAAAAQLAVVPTTLDFGSVVQGSTSTNATITVVNSGGSPTGAITTAITGTAASAFAVATSNCTTLAAQSSCTIVLRYTPSALGAQAATLTISGTPGGSVTTSLKGTGVVSGQLTINPTTQAFANTLVGSTTAATTFTITNTAGTSAGPLSVQFTGANAGEFHFGTTGTTCPNAVVPAAGSCTVTVVFAPTSVGSKTAGLLVTGGGTISASLSGNGLPNAALAISPSTKDFGSVGIGSTSAAQTFTITNVGGAATTVPAVTLTGTNPGEFIQTNNCTAVLAPAASCTVSVTFQPTTSALDSATLSVAAATGGTVTASLFGQGQNPAQISVLPSSLSFTATVGDVSPVQTFLVRNDGSVTTGPISVAISSGGVGGSQFSQTSTCTTLAAGATCTVSVMFAPTAAGNQTATATVSATPGGSATVALSGTARPRIEIVSINNLPTTAFDFGTQFIGTTTNASIVLRNNTSGTVTVTPTTLFPSPAQYAVNLGACGTITAGSSCTVTASFAPTSIGTKPGSASFAIGNGTANTATATFTGIGQPSITITPVTSANFGNIVVGQTSPALTFTVKNVSTLASGAITTNVLSAPFSQTMATTCGASMAPGGTCTIAIVFKPTTLGPISTTMIVTAASGGTATIDLSGTGVSATDLQLNPAPTSFGTVFAGTTKDITVVVTNPAGAQTAGPMAIAYSGDSTFTILTGQGTDCSNGLALPNGQTCNIRLHYAPVVFDDSGTHLNTGTLTVTANPGAVSGISSVITGISTSTISITPTSFDFGNLPTGSPSTSKQFTVHNDSTASVGIGTATFSGTSTDLSITSDTCSNTTLFANANCTLTVVFNPTVGATDFTNLVVPATNGFGRAVAALHATTARFCGGNCKILVIYADGGVPPNTVVNQLKTLPSVATVDLFDGQNAVPSTALMLGYDEVVAISDFQWANNTATGDNLAAYVAMNHPIVVFGFNFDTRSTWQLGGSAWTAISAFVGSPNTQFSNATLGTFNASSTLMAGVTALNAFYRNIPTLASGATLIASWSDSLPLIAVKGNVVTVNAYIGDYYGLSSGDFAKVIANATF